MLVIIRYLCIDTQIATLAVFKPGNVSILILITNSHAVQTRIQNQAPYKTQIPRSSDRVEKKLLRQRLSTEPEFRAKEQSA